MRNKTIFATTAIAALIATPAFAADMAVKVAPRAPAPVASSWTGCYVNGGVGYGLNNQDHFVKGFRDETSGGRGYLGTVGGGCDYQFSPANGWGTWVVGAFADYDFMDLHGAFNDFVVTDPASRKEIWAAAVGGRIGVLVTPSILTYVNGGWTATRFGEVNFPGTTASLPAHTFNGGFIGGGTEVAVAAVPGLYWRSEYRLSSYRPANLPFFVDGVAIDLFNHQSATVQTITTSLVWKFGATPASAIDVEGKAPPRASIVVKASPRVPVASTWTGCYVNGGVGFGLNNQDHFGFDPTGSNPNETSGGRGYLGRVGGGCDYQFNPVGGWGNWIVGAFADFDFMNLHGGFFDEATGLTAPQKEIWAAGVGGRIGLLVAPQFLTYVNGGWTPTRFNGVTFPTGVITLPAQTFSGGFIGGGTEFAVAAVPGLYWRNEYRLSSYRATDLQFSVNGTPVAFFDHQSATVQTITTSLVLKFH